MEARVGTWKMIVQLQSIARRDAVASDVMEYAIRFATEGEEGEAEEGEEEDED